MSKDKKGGPRTPDELYEEQLGKNRILSRERQEVADFNDEERAIKMADYNDDGSDVTQTANGKIISGRHASSSTRVRRRRKSLSSAFGDGNIVTTGKALAEGIIGLMTAGLTGLHNRNMSSQFGNTANKKAPDIQPPHEDVNYIYDTMKVSLPVHTKLAKESAIIARKLEEAQSIENPEKRAERLLSIEKLAEEYEMRAHPLTGVYVHDYHRVRREEVSMHGDKAVLCDANVCVFIPKADLADLRGIKSKVADQFDQTPSEVQASGDHLKGAAPAPHLT